jgi:hypothetical protein
MYPFRFGEGFWSEPAFDKIIEAIGPIPDDEGVRLAAEFEVAATAYRRYKETDRSTADRKRRERFEEIAAGAEGLLDLLGFKDHVHLIAGWPTYADADEANDVKGELPGTFASPLAMLLPALQSVAVERRGSAAAMGAPMRIKHLVVLLSDLVAAAHREGSSPRRGRGGARRKGHKAPADLVFAIFDIYKGIRSRCLNSGPTAAYGGPMLRFVRACVEAVDPGLNKTLTEKAIEGHFSSWKRPSK